MKKASGKRGARKVYPAKKAAGSRVVVKVGQSSPASSGGVLGMLGRVVTGTVAVAAGSLVANYWWERFRRGLVHLPGQPSMFTPPAPAVAKK